MQESPTTRSECLEIVQVMLSQERSPAWKQGLRTEARRETSRSGDQNSDGTHAEMELERELGMGGTE